MADLSVSLLCQGKLCRGITFNPSFSNGVVGCMIGLLQMSFITKFAFLIKKILHVAMLVGP